MKRVLTIIAAFALAGTAIAEERLGKPAAAKTETLEGVVIEKRANVKSYEAWNSPSDPYYVLDLGDVTETYKSGDKTWQQTRKRHVTLRPSPTVSTIDLAGLKGKRVALRGHHTEGEPHKPTGDAEQFPIEPMLKTKPNGDPEITGWQPANRGTGFVVEAITLATAAAAPNATKAPREIPAKLDPQFRPEAGVEYTLAPSSLYRPKLGSNPGPAEFATSLAWSFANEFVYRTALANEYVVPASGLGPTKDGWYRVSFSAKDGKSRRLVVEVDIEGHVRLAVEKPTTAEGATAPQSATRPHAISPTTTRNPAAATDAEIEQWIKQLASADRLARHKAADRLGDVGPAANRAIPALIVALKEEARRPKADSEMAATTEEGYGGCLIRVLAGFGKTAVPPLIEVLKKEADLRQPVLDVLGRIGPDAEDAVAVVVSLGKEADDETRASAIGTLGKIGRRSPQAISAMSGALGDSFQPVRAVAVRALGESGAAAKEAVPALIRAWKEEKDESVRQGILDALGLIGPDARDAVPTLTDALRHNEPIIRWCAARALGRIGPAAATAAGALREAASDKADYVRKQALESLEQVSRAKAVGGTNEATPSAPVPPSDGQGVPSDMLQKDMLQHKMIEPGVKEFFERARQKFAQTPSQVTISADALKKPGALGPGWKYDHDADEGDHGRFFQFLGQGAMLKLSGREELVVHLRAFSSAAQAREWALNRAFSGAAPTDSMLRRANRYFGKPECPGDFCFGLWLFVRDNVVVEYGSSMTDEAALRVSREVDKQFLGLTPEVIQHYADRIRSILPKGWSLQAGQSELKIARDEPVEWYNPISLPVALDLADLKAKGFVQQSKYVITLAFAPPMASGELEKMRDENAKTLEVLATVDKKIAPIWGKGHYVSRNDEERKLVAEHDRLRASLNRIPDFNTTDASIVLSDSMGGPIPKFYSEAVAAECKQVRQAVATVLAAQPAALHPRAETPEKFDEVILVEGKSPDISLLYVVLTEPKTDIDKLSELVVRHAKVAIQAAAEYKFEGATKGDEKPKYKGNVVFLVRNARQDRTGTVTGFSVEQLREIATTKPEAGRQIVARHHWGFGHIPDNK